MSDAHLEGCGRCRYWAPLAAIARTDLGTCKRYPPTMLVEGFQALPQMSRFDWCGEWAARDRGLPATMACQSDAA